MAVERSEGEYEQFNRQRIRESDRGGSDFDAAMKQLPTPSRRKEDGKT